MLSFLENEEFKSELKLTLEAWVHVMIPSAGKSTFLEQQFKNFVSIAKILSPDFRLPEPKVGPNTCMASISQFIGVLTDEIFDSDRSWLKTLNFYCEEVRRY